MAMRRGIVLGAALAVLTTASVPASAGVVGGPSCDNANEKAVNHAAMCDGAAAGSWNMHANPEIDGSGALVVIAMLSGVLALVGERRRRKT